jgi:hypothetical protein
MVRLEHALKEKVPVMGAKIEKKDSDPISSSQLVAGDRRVWQHGGHA